jgi:uncharacterized protein YggU (UPF0235/DUF167 family)
MERKFEFKNPKSGAALGVRVVTRSSATEIAGKNEDGSVKIRLMATSAGDATANEELVNFLAKQLGIEPSRIEVVVGATETSKILSIEGLNVNEVEAKLFND